MVLNLSDWYLDSTAQTCHYWCIFMDFIIVETRWHDILSHIKPLSIDTLWFLHPLLKWYCYSTWSDRGIISFSTPLVNNSTSLGYISFHFWQDRTAVFCQVKTHQQTINKMFCTAFNRGLVHTAEAVPLWVQAEGWGVDRSETTDGSNNTAPWLGANEGPF